MEIARFQQQLLDWYFIRQRSLPWREDHNPYRIWLSEVMLQQTQVATVIDYYKRFLAAYPTVHDLAAADEDSIFKLWEGLGYYSRARNLMKCAKIVVSEHNGIFPNDLKQMLKLPGIGPYTAGAILSIAYNAAVPAVDGNVLRVMSRVYESYLDISDPKTRPVIEQRLYKCLPEDSRHFNQALMELGATICTPKNPNCSHCPVSSDCLAFQKQVMSDLPVKLKKQSKTHHAVPVAYVTHKDKVLLIKRSDEGLLSGLWGFPAVTLEAEENGSDYAELQQQALQAWLSEYMDLEVSLVKQLPLGIADHVFTHKVWHMTLWHFEASRLVSVDMPQMTWVRRQDIKDFALPTAFVKLIQKSEKGQLST